MVGSDLGNAPRSWSALMGQTNGGRGQHRGCHRRWWCGWPATTGQIWVCTGNS